ncbi:MAG: aminoacyl-tRNA hydrolase [Pseudomonadota bacterium]
MADWVFVGLGNPGTNYALNRHNVGFMAIDVIADHVRAPAFKIKSNAALSEVSTPGQRLFLLKPQTFMNLSARGVAPLLAFYKIPLDHLVVFHDDLDLEPGRIKIKRGGSSGGHNGLKSLDESIGKDYWRVRIGIGHPGHKDAVTGYVLSNFRKEEFNNWVPEQLGKCATTFEDFLGTMDSVSWMNRIDRA